MRAPAIHRIRLVGCGALAVSMMFLAPAKAAEWSLDSSVRAGFERHTNITLTTGPHEPESNNILEPRLIAGVHKENWDISLDGKYRRLNYAQDNLDTNQNFLKLASQLRTERSLWELNADINNDDTLVGDVFNPDIGLTDTRTDRRTESIAPTWTGTINERTRLRLGYSGTNVRYTDGVSVGLFDYQNQAATGSLLLVPTEKDQLSFDLSASEYTTEDLSYTSDSTSASLGWSRTFSSTLSTNLGYGWYQTDSEQEVCVLALGPTCLQFGPATAENSGNTYSFDINKKLERGRIAFNTSLSVNPTSSGTETETTRGAITGEYRFMDQRLITTLILDGFRARAVGGIRASEVDRDYYRAEPKVAWRFTEDLTLEGSYRYSWVQYVGFEATTDDAVFATLIYRLPRLSASR